VYLTLGVKHCLFALVNSRQPYNFGPLSPSELDTYETIMNLNNLKKYECPDCGSPLQDGVSIHRCTKCPFSIGSEKLKSLINSKPKKYVEPDRSGWK